VPKPVKRGQFKPRQESEIESEDTVKILFERRLITLWGSISDESCHAVADGMFKLEEKGNEPITFCMCSGGGDTYSAYALIDIMNMVKPKIKIVGLGLIASAALDILIAGDERILSEYASIMHHTFSDSIEGKSHELRSYNKEVILTEEKILRHYIACTGKTKKYLTKNVMHPEDMWFGPKEARRHGLCDKVFRRSTIKNVFKGIVGA